MTHDLFAMQDAARAVTADTRAMLDAVEESQVALRALAAGVSDPMTGPLPTRWRRSQVERADAVAARTGLSRSAILRLAFDHGIAAVARLDIGQMDGAAGTSPVDQ